MENPLIQVELTQKHLTDRAWTEAADLNTGRESVAGSGSQTAGICISGSPNLAITEQFNGSSWTEVADLNTGRRYGNGLLQQELLILQYYILQVALLQKNKQNLGMVLAWTEVNDMNTGGPSVAGSGSYTSAISSSSSTSPKAQVEVWNGTIWRKDTDLNTGRDGGRGAALIILKVYTLVEEMNQQFMLVQKNGVQEQYN